MITSLALSFFYLKTFINLIYFETSFVLLKYNLHLNLMKCEYTLELNSFPIIQQMKF